MADVESLTSSVVREYLSRKGLKDTLAMLDSEMPRTSNCINNRAQLAKELHINGLMKKNKESSNNFRTMLEVIVQFMMTKAWFKQSSHSSTDNEHKASEQNYKIIATGREEEREFDNLDSSSKETEKIIVRGARQSENEKPRTRIDKKTNKTKTRSASSEEWTLGVEKKSENLSGSKVYMDNEWQLGVDVEKNPSRIRTKNKVREKDTSASFSDELGLKEHAGKQSKQQGLLKREELLEDVLSTQNRKSNNSASFNDELGLNDYTRKQSKQQGLPRREELLEDELLTQNKKSNNSSSFNDELGSKDHVTRHSKQPGLHKKEEISEDVLSTQNRKSNNSWSFSDDLGSKDHVHVARQRRRQTSLEKEVSLANVISSEKVTSTQFFDKITQLPSNPSLLKKTSNVTIGGKTSRRHASNVSGPIMNTGLNSSKKSEKSWPFKESLSKGFDETNVIPRNVLASKQDDHSLKIDKPSTFVIKSNKTEIPDWKKGITLNREAKKTEVQSTLRSIKNESYDELIFEDVNDNLDDELDNLHLDISHKPTISSAQSQPMTLKIAKDLKSILFGSSLGVFNEEWKNQGFTFCEIDHLKYGIIQRKGGPCGLLASVQAVVLKHLLFDDHSTHTAAAQHLRFSPKETNNALCLALTEILWRAGSYKQAFVTLQSDKEQFVSSAGYKPDKFTEKLLIYEFYDRTELELFLKENISQFSSDVKSGSIVLLCSAILSRSIEKIREDMDDPNGTLMGAHGYCTQDMVNLLLTGKAVSNTFDDVIELDAGGQTKNILKGIDNQSDIGLLSLFEYYKSCLVGSNLKNPRYPIWVVCSESHFSVLFSLKRNLLNERRSQKRFDLYYYDGLARQDEEIRLTIDTSVVMFDREILDDLTPPLELCIRTQWKDAVVDWNGTEPLL